jgi:outer membrane receptor for ferrienterochelin and colicin
MYTRPGTRSSTFALAGCIESAVLGNLNATWAATRNISLTGHVRNVADHQYIAKTTYTSGVYRPVLIDPRTYGAMVNVNF